MRPVLLVMAKWDTDGEWGSTPALAVSLADYLLAPVDRRPFKSKAELAREFEVTAGRVSQLEQSQQFNRYLVFRREQMGLDDRSMIEAAKLELWRKGMSGDTKALEQWLRMKGQFAAERHEIVHTDVRDMTSEEIEDELQRIVAAGGEAP